MGWHLPTKQFYQCISKCCKKSAQCTESEGVECLLEALFKHHEEAFRAMAKHNGADLVAAEKKMNAVQVEAMLSECRLGKEASRILFCHLNQFFRPKSFRIGT
jgi:hypothetical protein